MRVITQDGYGDIPYESAIFTIEYSGYAYFRILGFSQHFGDKTILVAGYSTKEKALETMEMMRKQHTKLQTLKTVLSGVAANNPPENMDKFMDMFTFKFPADERN